MNGHPTREEDFDLYALGALEGEEKQALEAHLGACSDCARKLEMARGRIALLALAAPPHSPPSRVRERLLRQVHAESHAPEKEKRAGWWMAILAPATAALALATILLWVSNNRLNSQLEKLRQQIAEQRHKSEETNTLLNLAGDRDTILVSLNSPPHTPAAQGHVLYNPRQKMLCYMGNLPALPPDKTYQLWLVPDSGNPISAGVFTPKSSGEGYIMMSPMAGGVKPKAFAVTIEPAGGVPQPTGPMVQVGPAT